MKIEFEIPEFEKELNINITIKKDGEVVCNTSASPTLINSTTPFPKPVKEKKKVENKSPEQNTPNTKPAGKPVGGNLMDMDF